ncbi:MAG TPA: Gmad2 immunoglobulin-like domain-containing protein, partial [Patescibacteria group bacterium]|nr:Gmad2 immunoglobulin-like domain-containing protein [Patescibacteria group bacterium]
MKKILFILIILVVLIGGWIGLKFLINKSSTEQPIACTMEAKECLDGSYVSRVSPKCDFALCPGEKEGILVISPKINEKIESPIKIEGEAIGSWFFEAQFNVVLLDDDENKLGEAILTAKSD